MLANKARWELNPCKHLPVLVSAILSGHLFLIHLRVVVSCPFVNPSAGPNAHSGSFEAHTHSPRSLTGVVTFTGPSLIVLWLTNLCICLLHLCMHTRPYVLSLVPTP